MNLANLTQRLSWALKEDGAASDVTTQALPGVGSTRLKANLLVKKTGVLCGGKLAPIIFKLLDPRARVQILKKDGSRVQAGHVVARIEASTRALLGGERLMLNLICHLSGIATLTRAYVDAVRRTSAKILDTRKTTPLWRDLERYAVACGGGTNHRFSLADAVLVKDNHQQFLANRSLAVEDVYGKSAGFRSKKSVAFVEIEATNRKQVWDAIKAKPNIILLDNMPLNQLKAAIEIIKAARVALSSSEPLIEVSGGVTVENAKKYAEAGVDRISVGALTHSAPALDLSLEVR